jgi:MHS family shikimate/dehydroshikimate transporter-like MFS transporter
MNKSNTVAVTHQRSILKVVLISLSGASIEWYDFFVYGNAAALVFPKLFFPKFDPLVGTLLSFATFGVAFIARPIGGIYFGNLGDKIGRKETLVIALILMGVATTLIGFLPPYSVLRSLAPVVLVILRFCQGLAVGGLWGGAVLIATENAPQNRRGFYGSFAQLGVPVGVIFANVLFLLVSSVTDPASFLAWGWRIPFLLSIVLIGVGLYVQLRLEETAAFEHVKETHHEARVPVLDALRKYPKVIALAAGAFIVVNGTFYILINYVLAYGKDIGVSSTTMLYAVLVASIFSIIAILGFAAVSDLVGRRKVYLLGALLLGLWGAPLFLLINTKVDILIFLAVAVGQIFLSMMYGPQAAFFSELFTPELRYSGASLGYQIGSVFGGALAPIIASGLFAAYRSWVPIAIYIAVMAAISLISVYLLAETFHRDVIALEGEEAAEVVI